MQLFQTTFSGRLNIFLFMKKTIAESNEKTKKFSHLNYCADRDFAV
ncbi:hypothetical protein NEISICOT_02088 [Neisseria sicca ATCC 29256]|uniref:Uncharacterized protein n=1 Tax=Neisseria sicca ATCC 29256 TaxID=547045 RepID=C6M6D6_NEISI|nr:hypothetical protein NEISICOT_02088 [Neisseria sicca ATCC 29256]